MPVRLHHIVIDAHDLPGLAQFWTQALGWKVLSERENEITTPWRLRRGWPSDVSADEAGPAEHLIRH